MVLRITLVILLLAAAQAKIVPIGSEPISDFIQPIAECDHYEQTLISNTNDVVLTFRAVATVFVRISDAPCITIENYLAVSPNSTLYKYMYGDTRLSEKFNFTSNSTTICVSICYRGAFGEFDQGGIFYTVQLSVTPQATPSQNITEVVQQVNQLSRVVETTQAAQAASTVQNTDQDQKINLLEYGFIALASVTVILMGLVIYLLVRSPKPPPPTTVMSSLGSIPAWQA